MYPLYDTRIHPKQRFVNPFFRVLSHCMDYAPIFVHARQTVGYKKIPPPPPSAKNARSPSALENARFVLLLFQPLFEIPLGTVNGTAGIMRQNAILGHQRCDHGVRILIKHRVVPHTKADLNVELSVLLVQKLCRRGRSPSPKHSAWGSFWASFPARCWRRPEPYSLHRYTPSCPP